MKHVMPKEAWTFLQIHSNALLLDVRMEIEALYVGSPPGAVNLPWYEYPELTPNVGHFVAAALREAGGDMTIPVLLICLSGARTLHAVSALEAAGFTEFTNIFHGFEGDPDPSYHRSSVNGWRFDGLPWSQS